MRMERNFGYIYGPNVSGDSLDVFDDTILAGSYRSKEVVQIFSISQR